MPTVTRVITTTSINVAVETINQLHTELSAVGLSVIGAEVGATPQFGEATSAQLKAFQQRYNLTVDGSLTPETGGILSLAALVAGETDLAKLREKLKVAANAVPNSSQYNYWTARYALMAGDFALAAQVMPLRFPDLLGVDLHNLVLTLGISYGIPEQPEVPLPENYYSYRYSVMSQTDIDALRQSAQQTLVPWIYRRPNNGSTDTFDPPHQPTVFNPPSAITLGLSRQQRLINSALAWLNAIEAWQFGNAEFAQQRFASATDAYDRCQNYILEYFSVYPDYAINFTTSTLAARVDELIWSLVSNNANWAQLWSQINWRRALLSLKELSQLDWTAIDSGSTVYQLLQKSLAGQDATAFQSEERKTLIDARVLIIAAVLAPLARGEANRLRRQSVAVDDFTRVLRTAIPVPNALNLFVPAPLKCEFIETPFARLLLIETLLDQAEAQYKSRESVDDETDADKKSAALAQLGLLAQDFTSRQIEGDATGNAANPFQHLVAALTYSSAIDAGSDYVANTKQALNSLHATVKTAVTNGDVSSKNFRAIGHTVTIPNVRSATRDLPGLTAGTHPHEPYLSFDVPKAEVTGRSNPRVYALLMQAQSRLLQIWSGFNYLGYRDDYVPPWHFAYLLDRARYFSEHAKNAQRDYLNFLNNAENEEFKEMSAAQNVELEKANVQIETARVDQATDEVAAANESATLADLNAKDAKRRLEDYISFENWMRVFDAMSVANSIEGGIFSLDPSKVSETAIDIGKAGAQRGNEEFNLRLAINEANQAQLVATVQLNVAQAGLVVAGLQRQAALLRHEFALQNLQFMRNQILNTEQWYRMAGAIRSVGDTYLRYAIQMAFLAQQAYNFEADKRLNIIRFDYDLSDVGAMLAADFLLRDLDTLEQDLVVRQQTRLQQVRYVLSLAREFPETLRALADTGEVMFSMRLEQLERHFPGLVNLRISNVDLLPVALMDPTRVSVQLTHLGAGMVRLKSQPGTSPLNSSDLATGDDWLPNAAVDWPVKIHVSGPETELFSGLSRQDAASASMITANERTAFEDLPAASSWHIDMSMLENQVVPGTLADVLITFILSGYYDSDLNTLVSNTVSSQRPYAITSFISVQRSLPDSYYSLVQYGKLDWTISERMLSLTGTPNELRNLAVILPLVSDGLELGRCYCRYPIRIEVSAGVVNVLTTLPQFTLSPHGLTLNCAYSGPADMNISWDFGDNTSLAQGVTVQHVYARPGRYEVMAQLAKDGKLVEYRSAVVVSAAHPIVGPLIVAPTFSAGTLSTDGTVALTVSLPPDAADISIDCSTGKVRGWADTGPATLNLKPGSYVLDFLAMRKLSARFYCRQRYVPTVPINMFRDRFATNRTFDASTGQNTTTNPNGFTTQFFGNSNLTISPVDRWTLELPTTENPWFINVSPSDVAEFDGGELSDAILSLEFVTSS